MDNPIAAGHRRRNAPFLIVAFSLSIYACTRNLFEIVPTRPSILDNAVKPLAHKACQSRLERQAGAWWKNIAASIHRVCKSFMEQI
jgi:hypothetical protein